MIKTSNIGNKTAGTMKADVGDINFLNTSSVFYHRANTDYWIQGDSGNDNWVTLSIPIGQITDETRTVTLMENGWEPSLKWQAKINNNTYSVITGKTTLTLSNNHNKIIGSFEFELEGDKKVSGSYNMENLHTSPL